MCDIVYIRNEIPITYFVRDRFTADVHIILTSQQTRSGGKQYNIIFRGQKIFEGQNDTLNFITVNTAQNLNQGYSY